MYGISWFFAARSTWKHNIWTTKRQQTKSPLSCVSRMGHIYSQRGSKLTMTTKHKIQENHQIQLVSPSLLFPCGFCCCCVLLLFTFPSFYFPEPRGLSVFFRPLFFNPIALGDSKYSFYFSFTISLLIMLKVVVWCMLHVCVCVWGGWHGEHCKMNK